MGKIQIQSGLQKDEIYNEHGDKIGIAVYDLDDVKVRNNILKLKNIVKNIIEKYQNLIKEAEKNKELDEDGLPKHIYEVGDLSVTCVNEMIQEMDKVFGKDFCKNAIGDSKNPFVLFEVLKAITDNYVGKSEENMKPYFKKLNKKK